ncbi:MAG: two pore domain potassium channel family protein [Mongoliibacter sp.]|uniref:potassium channel family protein n=1 Tax=Mongoliibacter sp. TaxID=2022438 RepID=UPI0012EF7609|nr:potassium channel family protein [Mongoliibacter sp.]TVP49601.1 MAG: two pore domain potassium channel family protein [Mongoliibacter sp.]
MSNYLKKTRNYWISDASFVTLLGMLIFTIFILPVLIDSKGDTAIFLNFMFISLFFIGVFSSNNKGYLIASISLLTIHLLLRLIRFTDNPHEFYLLERVVIILNLMLLVVINISLLFRDQEINTYRVIGAVNVYLLLALAGAFGFELIQLTSGNAIDGNIELLGRDGDYGTYIYFSLVSISTVGFGDIYAEGITAKMLAVFLSVLGILYPAVIIAKLVSFSTEIKK